jgi:hypothetical protein
MIDLSDLKAEMAELNPVPLPLDEIVRLHRRNSRRRTVTRGTAIIVVALVVALTLVAVNQPGRSHQNAGSATAPYVGTATAAFVTRNGLVYVADQGNNSLLELNPASNPPFEPVSTVPLRFTPGVVAVSPSGVTAYVSPLVPEFAGGSNALYEVNLVSHHVVRELVDRAQPLGRITIDPSGLTAYAWGSDIVPINLTSGRFEAPIARSTGEYTDFEIAPGGRLAVAVSDGPSPNYQEINLATGAVLRTVSTTDLKVNDVQGRWLPEAVTFSGDGTWAYIAVQQELAHSSRSGLLGVSVGTGRVDSGIVLGRGGVGNVVVSPDAKRAFVFVQVDIPGVYSGAFTVVPVDLTTNRLLPTVIVGDSQGLGLLQIPMRSDLFAFDTQWKVTAIDETTDRIGSVSTIPVPSLLAPTLQPIAFGG